MPVLVRIEMPSRGRARPNLYLGPSFGFNLNAERSDKTTVKALGITVYGDSETLDISDDIKSIDIGFVFGGVIESEFLFIDLRYSKSRENLFTGTGESTDIKNAVTSVMAGLRF